MKEDQATQQFMRRSIEQALSGNVKRQREIAARISQAQTETPLYGAVMDVADLTGMPHPPGIVYFVQNEGTFYYYNSVTPAFEPIINGVGSVADGSVTNAKLANMSAATVKGQIVGGSGAPVDLTATQLNAIVGSVALTMGNGLSISTDDIRARDSGGLVIADDAGVLGLFIQDATGFVGAGHQSPVTRLHVAETATTSSRGIMSSQHNSGAQGSLYKWRKSRGTQGSPSAVSNGDFIGVLQPEGWDGDEYVRAGLIGFQVDGAVSNDTVPMALVIYTTTTNGDGTERMRVSPSGDLGLGTSSPQGKFHILGTSGGKLFTTKTVIDGTAQTLIPDGTGDATIGVKASYIVTASGGASTFGSGDFLNNTDTTIFTTGGGSVLKFRVNSNGSVDLRRSSGSETFTVVVDMIWR